MATKHIHRIPVAEEFIVPIGEAVCVCQYLDDGLHCIGRRLSQTFYGHNEGKPSGTLNRNLKKLISEADLEATLRADLLELCERAHEIFKRRNAVVHSKSFTTPDGEQSRLHRSRANAPHTYLSPEGINEFTADAAEVAVLANSLLHDVRMPAG